MFSFVTEYAYLELHDINTVIRRPLTLYRDRPRVCTSRFAWELGNLHDLGSLLASIATLGIRVIFGTHGYVAKEIEAIFGTHSRINGN
jgi:hypothetical protein